MITRVFLYYQMKVKSKQKQINKKKGTWTVRYGQGGLLWEAVSCVADLAYVNECRIKQSKTAMSLESGGHFPNVKLTLVE